MSNQPKPSSSRVIIPRSPLGDQLHQAAAIKAQLTELLRELEAAAAHGQAPATPGRWRHDPVGWAKRYLRKPKA